MNQDCHTTANIIRLNPYLKGLGIEKNKLIHLKFLRLLTTRWINGIETLKYIFFKCQLYHG